MSLSQRASEEGNALQRSSLSRGVQSIVLALSRVRGPFIASLIALIVFQIPQFIEILIVFAEDRLQLWPELLFSIVSFLLFVSLLFRLCHDLLAVSEYNAGKDRFRAGLKRFFPIIIAAIPVLGLSLGIDAAYNTLHNVQTASLGQAAQQAQNTARQIRLESRLQPISPEARDVAGVLNTALTEIKAPESTLFWTLIALVIALAASVVFAFTHSRYGEAKQTPNTGAGTGDTSDDDGVMPTSLRLKWVWLTAFVLLLGLFATQSLHQPFGPSIEVTQIARLFGALPLIFLFLIFLAIFLSLLTRFYDRFGVPLIAIIVIVGLVASYFDWNDNHAVRTIKRDTVEMPPLGLLFSQWLENRPGGLAEDGYVRKFIKAKGKFPVYLVAAQGGGHYAASFASSTLSKLFDRCPALGRHFFALSGVSGGSVGSGVFVSFLKAEMERALKEQAQNPSKTEDILSDRCDDALLGETHGNSKTGVGPIEEELFKFQGGDFLSPLLAETLFGDMVQRAIPVPIPLLDRARAFEAGIESAFRLQTGVGGQSALNADFVKHWTPQSNYPMLMLNTTRVQTGEPITIAPFLTRQPVVNGSEVRTIYGTPFGPGKPNPKTPEDAAQSITLLSAMSLSARFPYVTPAGRLHGEGQSAYFDLVDGGLFETSGVDTLTSILNQLDFYAKYPALLSRINDSTRDFYKDLDGKIEFKVIVLNELSIYTFDKQNLNELLSTPLALYRARSQRAAMAINTMLSQKAAQTKVIRLSHDPFALPLGWQLSTAKRHLITRLIGQPDQCTPNGLNKSVRTWLLSSYIEGLREAYGWDKADANEKANITQLIESQSGKIWNLFYLMNSNRCILKDIVDDISLPGARNKQATR